MYELSIRLLALIFAIGVSDTSKSRWASLAHLTMSIQPKSRKATTATTGFKPVRIGDLKSSERFRFEPAYTSEVFEVSNNDGAFVCVTPISRVAFSSFIEPFTIVYIWP